MVFSVPHAFRRAAVAAALTGSLAQPLSGQAAPAVRVLNPVLAGTLRDALPASPTLRAIVDEIERSDLIVHIVALAPQDGRRHLGALRFVASAPGGRYLRIGVEIRLSPERRVEMLGHELFHAVEVARSLSVVDEPSLAALYGRIGQASRLGFTNCFETDAARRAGSRVRAEVRHHNRQRRAHALSHVPETTPDPVVRSATPRAVPR